MATQDLAEGIEYMVLMFYAFSIPLLRSMNQWYFICYFNYPWYPTDYGSPTLPHEMIIGLSILAQIIACVLFLVGSLASNNGVLKNIFFILYDIILYIPNFMPLVVQCIVGFKYQRRLHCLMAENFGPLEMLEKYKRLYYDFKRDYPMILGLCVQFNMVPILIYLWLWRYENPNDAEIALWECLNGFSVIILFFTTGCHLNETLEKLHKYLWGRMEENFHGDDLYAQTTLLMYINMHPIHFKLGGLRVTKKNTLIFVGGFIVSKAASMLITYLY